MGETRICPKCGKPQKTLGSGSLTQWITVCTCAVGSNEPDSQQAVLVCAKCHRKIESTRDGSFTQWIFKENRCTCEVPEPIAAIAVPAKPSPASTVTDDHESDNEVELEVSSDHFPLERYKPIALLGSGAAGDVYLCRDRLLGKKVALKTLRRVTSDQLISFQREARATSKLHHPNVINVLDFGATAFGAPFMVMDYFRGQNLDQYLKEQGPLSVNAAAHLLELLCRALIYAHENGIYHRDLKPSNVLLIDGASDIRLIDFGIASVKEVTQEPTIHQGITIAGTPAYMSPDQIAGQPYDARSEIYSLGCLLFECLTGRPPFVGETPMETLSMHANQEPPTLAEVAQSDFPEWLEKLVAKSLAKKPADRFSDVEEMLKAGSATQEKDTSTTIEPVEQNKAETSKMRLPLPVVLSVLAALVVAVVLFKSLNVEPNSKPALKPDTANLPLHNKNFEIKRDSSQEWTYAAWPINDVDLKELKGKEVARLQLQNCDLDGRGLRYLTDSHVRTLVLDHNPLKDENMDYLNQLTDLEQLSLANTRISFNGLERLTDLKNLKALDLRECQNVDDSCMVALSKFPDLQALQLGPNPQMTTGAIWFVARFKRLKVLDITEFSISKDQLKMLAALPLERLYMRSCELTDDNLMELQGCRTLRILALTFTPVSKEAVAKLRKSLPLCEIDYSTRDADFNRVSKNLKQTSKDQELVDFLQDD